MAKDDTFTRDDLKDYQDTNEGDHDSGKAVSRAEHQAANDYQDDGGDLPNRDRSSKEDVPSVRSFDDDETSKAGEDE